MWLNVYPTIVMLTLVSRAKWYTQKLATCTREASGRFTSNMFLSVSITRDRETDSTFVLQETQTPRQRRHEIRSRGRRREALWHLL